MRRKIAVAVTIVISLSVNAIAFDGKEHIQLSNLALRTALASVDEKTAGSYKELSDLLCSPESGAYGVLVSLADYTRDVSEILGNDQNVMGLPHSGQDLDWGEIREIQGNAFSWFEAVHTNDTHFQVAALTTYWHVHDRAKTVAANGNLFAAMALEAYADHFLQDFFAPGHVITPRTELVDFASLALHDRTNRRGLDFSFAKGFSAELLKLVQKVENTTGSCPHAIDPDESAFQLTSKDFSTLRAAISEGSLRFYGDSKLRKNGAQAAFIIAATADSINEVLLSYTQKAPQPNRDEPCFFMGIVALGTERKICGEAAHDWEPSKRELGDHSPSKPSHVAFIKVAKTRFGRFDLSQFDVSKFFATWFSPLDLSLISAYGAWAPEGRQENGSGGVKIETLLAAIKPGVLRQALEAHQPTPNLLQSVAARVPPVLTIGISRRWDDRLSATRGELRYIYPFPRIDLQVYSAAGVERVSARGDHSWELAAGVGVEVGYGLLYFHLGVENNVMLNSSGNLEPRDTFRAGVTVMLPRSLYWK
jgi:hypothetical protein